MKSLPVTRSARAERPTAPKPARVPLGYRPSYSTAEGLS
jgi:hypothetical protein